MRRSPLRALDTRIIVAAVLTLGINRALEAQFRADPGAVVNGKVVVTAYVTLSDLEDSYFPLSRFQLVLHGPQRDSTVLRTNDAGVVTTTVPAGNYRLVSSAPYDWKGRSYRWSLPVTVRPGMAVVDLTMSNAVADAPAAPTIASTTEGAVSTAPASRVRAGNDAQAARSANPSQPYRATGLASPKDGGVAVLFSVLLTGGGQMYAGKPGKGVALLLTSVGAVAVGMSASSCTASAYSYDSTCDVTPLAVGMGVALGNWIYSMVTAPGDVRAWNAKNAGVAEARMAPVVSPSAAGTQVGLALRW